MKKSISFLFLFVSTICFAQNGTVYDNLSLKSEILDMDRKYAIYLPAGYETSERSYPVLYLLHGGGDDQTGWVQFGEVQRIASNSIQSGDATAMIIVMPDANTTRRGYFNNVNNEWRYEDFFFEEFMPFIEKTYRTKNEKRYRAIAGLSMGGGGSFFYAMHHPELFSSACPLSASVRSLSLDDYKTRMDRRSEDQYTDEQLQSHHMRHNALSQIESVPVEDIKSVKWFFDCGDDDFLYEGNSLVHIAFRKKEIPHEFRIRDGRHSWKYWRASLPVVLSFVSDTFHQN